MTDLLIAPVDPDAYDDEWMVEHIVCEIDPNTALCGADMTDCASADGTGELCVVCAELSGEVPL